MFIRVTSVTFDALKYSYMKESKTGFTNLTMQNSAVDSVKLNKSPQKSQDTVHDTFRCAEIKMTGFEMNILLIVSGKILCSKPSKYPTKWSTERLNTA